MIKATKESVLFLLHVLLVGMRIIFGATPILMEKWSVFGRKCRGAEFDQIHLEVIHVDIYLDLKRVITVGAK